MGVHRCHGSDKRLLPGSLLNPSIHEIPFRGIRVYARSAVGMTGSETALEELMRDRRR